MKRCPNCQRTYTDNSLSYCLHDGTQLIEEVVPPPYNPPPYNPGAYDTTPASRPGGPGPSRAQSSTPMVNQMRPSPTWSPMPVPQPRRRSVWPWVIGGVAIVGVMALGVLILILAIASRSTTANRNRNATSPPANRNANPANANVRSATTREFTDDFSVQSWGTGSSSFGDIRYKDGEYYMHANKGGYMVMLGPDRNYDTGTGTVRVTARSVDGVSPTAGYGLVVHAEKSRDKDEMLHYAFLIRTDEKPAYKVIQQRGGTQKPLTGWTRSAGIRSGTSTNRIEVRTMNEWLLFYINGQYLTRIMNTAGSLSGRVGLYTTDANEVAFDDLEIIR